MNRFFSTILLLLFSLILLAAASPKDVKKIHQARVAFNAAIAAHDIKAIGQFLADDYVITISDGSTQRSREAHLANFAEHFAQFPDVKYVRNPTAIQTSETHPHAIEHGTWVGTRTTENGTLKNGGEYTAAWKRTEKGWVIYAELFVALSCVGEDC